MSTRRNAVFACLEQSSSEVFTSTKPLNRARFPTAAPIPSPVERRGGGHTCNGGSQKGFNRNALSFFAHHGRECVVLVRRYTAYCYMCRLVRPAGKQHGSALMAQRHILRILRVQWRSLPELDGHAHSEGEPRRL